ncbi:hydroxyacid dehydrogenase [Serratia nematodiphila]|uniref:hydroxyacid dehydrogenase n=1 Tax=Serratia marcescens TaxID=615 RepID=UPI00148E6C92|nr:hydroxyacid dehydrogenase [Serratia marcescens]MBM1296798.1 hydroxyacid dehydrogenase [Serratia nematodiphila]QJU40328.1 hydroxyacid dehydrogenase [Serratia marcescens]BEO42622.1 hydroxyacid dehydrogenase [Serratia marcescens]
MPNILVAGKIHQTGLDILANTPGFSVRLVPEVSVESYAPYIAEADALLIRTQPLTAREIRAGKKLRIVSRHGVGYDSVDIAALTERNIPLTLVGDVNSLSVAEHTITLLLAVAKRTCHFDRSVRTEEWDRRNSFSAVELAGRSLFILGFGRIGREVARLAQCFRMRVMAYDPFLPDEVFAQHGVTRIAEIDAGLPLADAVTLHLPLSGDAPLIDAAALALMKRHAILINTARGGLVDENALATALENDALGGSGLDVLQQEPPPAHSALLLQNDRLILSPHSAGLTEEAAMRMSAAAATNIVDYFHGRLNAERVANKQVLSLMS